LSKKNLLTKLSIATACVALAIAPSIAAQAATASYWGEWSDPVSGGGTITFADAGAINATYTTMNTDSVESDAGSNGKWFPATSPVGADWGASDVATKARFRLDAVHGTPGELNVVFDQAVAAGDLAIAVSDVDGDAVTVTAKDDAGNDLAFDAISGTVTNQTFNFCTFAPTPTDCSGDTDVPVLTHTATSVTADGSASNTEGATVWFVPSAAVKSIKFVSDIHGAVGEVGHHDFWIAQKAGANPVAYNNKGQLAHTGADFEYFAWMSAFAVVLIGAGTLMVRRRS